MPMRRKCFLTLAVLVLLTLSALTVLPEMSAHALASSGTWSATGSMATARDEHTATLLASGKVLVAGGLRTTGGTLASSGLHDPARRSWSATGSLTAGRADHAAALSTNGKVLD